MMALKQQQSQTNYHENPDESEETLLNCNNLQCEESTQTNTYPTETASILMLNSEKSQQQFKNLQVSSSPSNTKSNIRELLKIAVCVIKISVCLFLINMVATSNSPMKDKGNWTNSETNIEKRINTTLILTNDNSNHKFANQRGIKVKPTEIYVSSIQEYKEKIQEIPQSNLFTLHIITDTPSELSPMLQLPRSQDVTEITIRGCIGPTLLYQLLMEFSNIGAKVTLKKLYSIKLQNVTSCNFIYSLFSYKIQMIGVQFLEISHTQVTEENISAIKTLLENVSYSIRTLKFPDVQWNAVLFENFVSILPNLVELRIDFLTKLDVNSNFLGTINQNAPNLQKLTSKHGYLQYFHLSSITSLKNLAYLSFGLQIPEKYPYMDVSILTRSLNLLTLLELSLSFDNPSNCKVLENGLSRRNLSISYYTQCDLIIGTS